ncbi:energy transducer TonB [Aquiflexum sp.]|uniref:energy transducer TonB n=1 Tax=Aquiflexum sp. TaxID=1872584 RepID=UPI0035932C31
MKKIIYLAIFIFLSSSFMFAQKNKTVFLDKHFLPLSTKDIGDAQYQKTSFPISSGKQTEKIEDLDGKLIKLITNEFDGKKNLIRSVIEDYGENESIYKISSLDVNTKKEMIEYFHEGILVGRFLCNDNEVIFGLRVIDGENVETSKNEFEPGFAVSKQQFRDFLWSNLDYPEEAKKKKIEGTVTLALEIMPDGTVNTLEVINHNEVPIILQEEAKRVISAFDKGFRSALDMDGNPVRKWMYVPVRFSLG